MEGSLVAYKVFSNGSVLNASEINDNLMNQSVMVFSNSTTRAAALTAPVEGMLTWLEDVNRYESYNGTAWVQLINPNAWTSYTPTTTGLTLGNGTIAAKYNVVGKIILITIRFTLGSTSAITGIPTFTIPSGFTSASLSFAPVGDGIATISSVSYILTSVGLSSNRIATVANNASGTYTTATDLSSTIPATWNNGSILELNATLEIA
jgi:hypothetical protein